MPAAPHERAAAPLVAAILGGCLLIALSIAVTFRFEVTANAARGAVTRLDRWTGEIRWCSPDADDGGPMLKCAGK